VWSFRNWSLRYKLLVVLLHLGITAFAVTGAIAYLKHLHSLKRNVVNQLTSIRRAKAYQIESYYRTIHNHVLTLSVDQMFIDAMKEFHAAYKKLNAVPVSKELRNAVSEDYRVRVYPRMLALKIARPRFENYLPVTPAAFHLQYNYIVKNPFPAGRLREMQRAEDGSEYSRVHAKYHHSFQKIVETYGYYDIYLIDDESERVVYDVNKDRDLGTSLQVGPHRESNLAKVVKQCLATDNPDDVFFSDFEPYEANLGEPTQWVASPIFDGKKRVGILALLISTAHLEDVVTGRRGWQRDGLGQSGRSNIVGPDYRVRTNVRPFLENPEKFLAQLKADGASEEKIARIRAHNSTILEAEIRRPSVTAALGGKEGNAIEKSPFGPNPSLVSYMPLNIEGLHWVFESRMDTSEAFKPVTEMQHFFIWWGAVIFLLTVTAALLMTRLILRPVDALAQAARRVAAGDLTAKAEWQSEDELGMLCNTFNSMTKSIREKTELIEQKNRENEALLLNILPGEIANRLKGGESEIADSFADVSVLFGDLVGFTAMSARMSAGEIVDMLNGLFSRFDRVANELGIEKIKTIGDSYMAVCGLPKRCPDHTERIARMALRMLEETREYGNEKGLSLQMRIGLNAGPVVAGVIGTSKFIYDLWGDTVNIASRMESTGVPGEVQVTRSVYERLKDTFQLQGRGVIQVKGKGEIETWLLHGQMCTLPLAG
jgi:class 3 adenylate cyclase